MPLQLAPLAPPALFQPNQFRPVVVKDVHRLLGGSDPPTVAFMGHMYPIQAVLDARTEWRHDEPLTERWLDGMLADPGSHLDLISYLLSLTLPSARAVYIYCLQARKDQVLTPEHHRERTALMLEEYLYLALDSRYLNRRVYPRVLEITPGHHSIKHMLWTGNYRPGDRPSLSYFGHTDVPVHRLLWPRMRRDLLAPTERLRRAEVCPENTTCVNPTHYEHSYPLTISAGHTPGKKSEYPRYRYEWGMRNVRQALVDGRIRDVVFCPKEHRFGPGVQNSYWIQRHGPHPIDSPQGQAVCPQCKEDYLAATGGVRRPRGAKPGHHREREESRLRDEYAANKALREAGMLEYMPDE